MRNLIAKVLTGQGYRVVVAQDGEETYRLSQSMTNAPDMVLTDYIMPKLNGSDLATRLRRKWSHIKIVFMTGYTSQPLETPEIDQDDKWLLRKPFSISLLTEKVRIILDG